jgi:hypothetical protein
VIYDSQCAEPGFSGARLSCTPPALRFFGRPKSAPVPARKQTEFNLLCYRRKPHSNKTASQEISLFEAVLLAEAAR